MTEAIYNYLKTLIPLKPEEFKPFAENLEPRRFNKKEYLIQRGEVENYVSFISEGLVKVFFLDGASEKCLDFWFENNFFSSYSSFLSRTPSKVFIQALVPTTVLRIHFNAIQTIYQETQVGNQIGRHIAEMLFMAKTQREMDLLSKTAEMRYLDLVEKNPKVVQCIPVKDIASYLGIHPESLSRIRQKVKKNLS